MISVPFVSQLGADADKHGLDCGAACAAMILGAYNKPVPTVNDLYDAMQPSGDTYLSAGKIIAEMDRRGVPMTLETMRNLGYLFNRLREKKPVICLISYAVLLDKKVVTGRKFRGAHFLVVNGITDEFANVLDPLTKEYPIQNGIFEEAWNVDGIKHGMILPKFGVNVVGYNVRVLTWLNVRPEPNVSKPPTRVLPKDATVLVQKEQDGWGFIGDGWIKLSYTVRV